MAEKNWPGRLKLAILLFSSSALTAFDRVAYAQLIPDTTLGREHSRVIPQGVRDLIAGGAIRDTTLFHSFLEFNVNKGQQVYFANPNGIANILTRVTGSNISQIEGTLGVNGRANLFLINPQGIIFGPHAKLNVVGSLTATTAESLILNNYQFSATSPSPPPLLKINLTQGLQYGLSHPAGQIRNEGILSVGQDLSLIGGNLNLAGQLYAGNNLTLVGTDEVRIRDSASQPFIAAAGGNLLVQGNQTLDIFALNHPNSGFFSGGDLVLKSDNPVLGDAHYTALGNFRIEQLDGKLGDLVSPHDPTIQVGSDVTFNAYYGTSLHILASGSVTILGGVVIGAKDPIKGSIDHVTLSDGTPISINGRTQPTLDVRAGTTNSSSQAPTSANITIGSITNPGGMVFLTNQYQPNLSLPGGAINVIGAITTGNQSGDGGSVIIDSRSTIALKDAVNASSGNFILGKGGDITLIGKGAIATSEILSLGGLGGNINLTSNGQISIVDRPISTISLTPILGTQGGDINIKTGSLSLTNGALAIAATGGAAHGGRLNVTAKSIEVSGIDAGGLSSSLLFTAVSGIPTARDLLSQNLGSGLFALTLLGTGAAGDIKIQTERLITQDGARIGSYTYDQGHGGDLTVNASELVKVSGTSPVANGGLFAETYNSTGDAGNLSIDTKKLIVQDGALVSASNVSGQGNGGNLTVNASEAVELGGNTAQNLHNSGLGIYARGTGNSGALTVNTRRLSLQDGAFIATATFTQGKGGDVTVNASDSVEVSGISSVNGIPSALSTDTFAQIPNAGNAGNLMVNTQRLIVRDGGIVSASTYSSGQGGSLVVDASKSVELSGFPSGLYAQGFGSGNAGNLQVTTDQLSVQNGAKVTVATGLATNDLMVPSVFNFGGDLRVSFPQQVTGDAGRMMIAANTIRLDRQGSLTAKTVSGEGGNITLQVRDFLLMRRQSQISTNAGGTGNGGNIEINSPLIAAIPYEDSDITANAVRGRGGNINITTQGIYGLRFRPYQTPLSDITATGKVSNGTVEINVLHVDPTRGLTQLPISFPDPSKRIVTGCAATRRGDRFVVTGRGGLPEDPRVTLRSQVVTQDFRATAHRNADREREDKFSLINPRSPIIEAQGWIVNQQGRVELVARSPQVNQSYWQDAINCSQ